MTHKVFSINKIKKSTLLLSWMWWYMLIVPICIYWMNLPKFIVYFGDLIGVCVLFITMQDLIEKKRTNIKSSTKIIVVIFIVFGTISAIINTVNPLYYIWGIRNSGRFFLFFLAASMYLNVEDLKKTLKIIKTIFWLSLPLCVYETFFISYSADTIIGDMVGGIYHNFNGVTMPLNIILVIVSIYILNDYFQNKINIILMSATLSAAVIMSVLSELKIFIIELIIIIIVLMIVSKKIKKTIIILLFSILSFSYIITFFVDINARGRTTYSNIFSIDGFMEYISKDTGYDGVGDLNRLSGINTLNNSVFENNLMQHIIGCGIGSAEYTSFFITPFYLQYNYLHYSWFQMIWVYVENGYIGIIAMFLFWLTQFIDTFLGIKDVWLKNFCVTLMILLPILFIYNVTLRSETVGFYLYFVMAMPCVCRNKKHEELT